MSKSRKVSNQFWSKLPIAYRGAIIIGIPTIAILPAIISWSWSSKAKSDAYWWVNHTQEVIRESNSLIRVLVDAETGIRGYAVTQDPAFLEPYELASAEIPQTLQKLERLTQDNLTQQQKLAELEVSIESRAQLLRQTLGAIKTEPTARQDSQLNRLFDRGKQEMDAIRDSVEAFKAEEWMLLNVRQQRLAHIGRKANILQAITIATSLLAYVLAIKLYYDTEKELQEKLQELAQSNRDQAETNQLAKERNQELDRFTYIVSHDLKAPLRAIANLSSWIEEDLADNTDEDIRNNLQLLQNRVGRMNSFIDGLLAYSRASRMVGKEKKNLVNVRQLITEIIDSIAPPTFKIEIDHKIDPIELKTEAILLQQVFSNLISNAVKHHHRDDGQIIISAEDDERYYQFSVADDGRGIAPEYRDKIFVIFQTAANEDNKENTGIGLSIVKKIVEQQGGKIWLESEVDRGTKFIFTWSKS